MFEKICEILAEHFDVDAADITPDTSLKDDLGADSLDMAEMVMILEDEYSLSINIDEEMKDINTVGEIVDFLKSRGLE